MKINVYSIEKSSSKSIKNLIDEYKKMCIKFAQVEDNLIFNKNIAKAQNLGEQEAKKSYTEAFLPYLDVYNISLDLRGEKLSSEEFSEIFQKATKINFFIGGAYGLNNDFLKYSQKVISLSTLTYAHKIARLVLFEQIYRGLSIRDNHPYHK